MCGLELFLSPVIRVQGFTSRKQNRRKEPSCFPNASGRPRKEPRRKPNRKSRHRCTLSQVMEHRAPAEPRRRKPNCKNHHRAQAVLWCPVSQAPVSHARCTLCQVMEHQAPALLLCPVSRVQSHGHAHSASACRGGAGATGQETRLRSTWSSSTR